MRTLTRDRFTEYKQDYNIYGTHTEMDRYRNEYKVKDTDAKATIHVMWQPLTDAVALAEYGSDVAKMFYCIMYEDANIDYGDVVTLYGDDYEVAGIKYFNTYTRIDVKKKKA